MTKLSYLEPGTAIEMNKTKKKITEDLPQAHRDVLQFVIFHLARYRKAKMKRSCCRRSGAMPSLMKDEGISAPTLFYLPIPHNYLRVALFATSLSFCILLQE
jgi:hypothetical protein